MVSTLQTQQFADESEKTSHRKFFKKKSSTAGIKPAPSNQSIVDESQMSEWPLPGTGLIQSHGSTGALRVQRSASPRLSITDDDAVMILQKTGQKWKVFKTIQFQQLV